MANKVGALIKEARTGAKLTQEQLAKKISGLTAADISKAERGELDLSQAQLKAIAKATGVTQASLLNAAKEGSKPAAKKPAAKKTAAKKDEVQLTAAEKKLVELYRAADKNTRDAAVKVLKGEKTGVDGILGSILGGAADLLSGKK
ncbi:MAG: helix-turn-helix transcriptional regulator [Oscillospiraceae bacterium]|nr:helix-turn-helix transcriptional regulator [Oscillospiraceae bacterium]